MYKRVLQPIVFVLLMAVVYGCNQKTQTSLPSPLQNDSASVTVNEQEDAQKDGKLTYKQVEQSKKDKSGEYKIVVDFPTSGNPILVNAIREYISESLGISYAGEMENNMQGSYSGDLGDGQKMIDYYFDLKYKEFKNAHDEMAEHMQGDVPTYVSETEIHYLYETDKFVTYEMKKYEDMGGAHGGTFISGMTFRKSDGRRVEWDLFTKSMQDVIKKGLKLLPLPATPPVFTKEGVLFTYQQYEIAAYAAGLPSFIVPYNEAKSLMNTTGNNLLP